MRRCCPTICKIPACSACILTKEFFKVFILLSRENIAESHLCILLYFGNVTYFNLSVSENLPLLVSRNFKIIQQLSK